MQYVDIKFDTPEENISFDEVLLTEAEGNKRDKMLRIWEIENYTVVLGRGCSLYCDVFVDRCKKDNIKILKRISGGGTILLGKGCLNYSLILPYAANSAFLNIKSSYKYILDNIADGFFKKGINLKYYPISDLALSDKKVSGNAQARRRKFFLHHGTILYNFDIDRITFYLKEPKKMPLYRDGRIHKNFLVNLPLLPEEIKEIIKNKINSLF